MEKALPPRSRIPEDSWNPGSTACSRSRTKRYTSPGCSRATPDAAPLCGALHDLHPPVRPDQEHPRVLPDLYGKQASEPVEVGKIRRRVPHQRLPRAARRGTGPTCAAGRPSPDAVVVRHAHVVELGVVIHREPGARRGHARADHPRILDPEDGVQLLEVGHREHARGEHEVHPDAQEDRGARRRADAAGHARGSSVTARCSGR